MYRYLDLISNSLKSADCVLIWSIIPTMSVAMQHTYSNLHEYIQKSTSLTFLHWENQPVRKTIKFSCWKDVQTSCIPQTKLAGTETSAKKEEKKTYLNNYFCVNLSFDNLENLI